MSTNHFLQVPHGRYKVSRSPITDKSFVRTMKKMILVNKKNLQLSKIPFEFLLSGSATEGDPFKSYQNPIKGKKVC